MKKQTPAKQFHFIYLFASFMDPKFHDLSFLSKTERSALVEFASKTVKAMPSLPASSDVASTTSLETDILPLRKKKSKLEVAMEELLGKAKWSNQLWGIHGPSRISRRKEPND